MPLSLDLSRPQQLPYLSHRLLEHYHDHGPRPARVPSYSSLRLQATEFPSVFDP